MTVSRGSSRGSKARQGINPNWFSLCAVCCLLSRLWCPAALCLLYLANAHSDPRELGMGEAVALLTATLSIGGFQSAGFASNHQVSPGV